MSAAETLAGAAPDPVSGWHAINWLRVARTVRRLQARIVKAVREGRWGKVQALVYLLTHSFAGRALAIRRVTTNRGAHTPGVDGIVWNTPELKTTAFHLLRRRGYRAQPLRRVYTPKSNGKLRPLGIPTMIDRAQEAFHLLGLDPILETTADSHSYGFRRGRRCADALDHCHKVLGKRGSADWVFEGDICSCFDRISHDWLLTHIPMDKVMLRKWLQAGYLEKDVFFDTTDGTPQGGIISPALANATLDGLQALLHERFGAARGRRDRNKVHLVRYADDFVITGTSPGLLQNEVQPLVAQFLRERGLELAHEKTRITRSEDGFDFLGQHLRRFGSKLLLRPSRKNVQTFLAKIDKTIQKHGGHGTTGDLLQRLNEQIVGWSLYHRHGSSASTFGRVDSLIYQKLWRWARRRHRKRSKGWVYAKYVTRHAGRGGVFHGRSRATDGRAYPVYLRKATAVGIVRHVKIQGTAHPYDPSWELYFEERLTAKWQNSLTGQGRIRYLWLAQEGKCCRCQQPLTEEEGWHIHHRVWRTYGGDDTVDNLELLHPNCHRQLHCQASGRRT